MATGLILIIVAVWVFLRTIQGQPRLANVLLSGFGTRQAAGG